MKIDFLTENALTIMEQNLSSDEWKSATVTLAVATIHKILAEIRHHRTLMDIGRELQKFTLP